VTLSPSLKMSIIASYTEEAMEKWVRVMKKKKFKKVKIDVNDDSYMEEYRKWKFGFLAISLIDMALLMRTNGDHTVS
jgi:hypothetical protein